MRISFDLDDTLILTGDGCLYEAPIKFPYSLFYKEQLRRGTINLCNQLTALGYEVCVYTTSERSERYIKKLFSLYGIKLKIIINQKKHLEVVQGKRKEIMPSKFPSRFGIDLHIDDDISVKQNGMQYGFKVLIINKSDEIWYEKVIAEAKRLLNQRASVNN